MTNQPYSNRELDMKFEQVHEKLDTIITQVTFTNGKVKRIIIVLIGIIAFTAGMGLVQGKLLLKLLGLI